MRHYLIWALAVVLCDRALDRVVDWQLPGEVGYTLQDRLEMERLVRRATAEQVRHDAPAQRHLTEQEAATAEDDWNTLYQTCQDNPLCNSAVKHKKRGNS